MVHLGLACECRLADRAMHYLCLLDGVALRVSANQGLEPYTERLTHAQSGRIVLEVPSACDVQVS